MAASNTHSEQAPPVPTQIHSMPFPSSQSSPATPALSETASTPPSSQDHTTANATCLWDNQVTDPSVPSSSNAKLASLQKFVVERDPESIASDASKSSNTSRPISHRSGSFPAISRPSSVASNSSAGESSYASTQARVCVSPSILVPSLASALGIGIAMEPKKATANSASSLHSNCSSPPSAAGSTSSNYLRPSRRSTGGASSASGPSSSHSAPSSSRNPRRPSLPNVATLSQHRVSTISVSSFESLPENEILPSFGGSPHLHSQPVSRQSSTRSYSSERQPASPGLAPNLMLPPSSVPPPRDCTSGDSSLSLPGSPTTPSAGTSTANDGATPSASAIHKESRPGRLQRSRTEPINHRSTVSYEEAMRKRELVAQELLTTEKAYVDCLQVIQDCFYQPLLARAGGLKGSPHLSSGPTILSRKALSDIFSNFIDILHLNTELSAQLEARLNPRSARSVKSDLATDSGDQGVQPSQVGQNAFPGSESGSHEPQSSESSTTSNIRNRWNAETDTVGDILVPIAPFLKMYSLYVKNFSSALNRIEAERRENDAFARFLKETEKSTWGRGKGFYGLGLQAHLLSIVQRIPRYKLLVGDLLKYTPSFHRDHNDLQKAFGMIEQVASTINENVRQHEMIMLMLAIQRSLLGVTTPLVVPGRSLVKRGTLMKACRKDIQARAFFLFNDCIVYARPSSGGGPASIEAAWTVIARAGGIAATGPLAKFNISPTPSALGHRGSRDRIGHAGTENFQPRVRISSGNLFSANAILDVLQNQQAPQLQFREQIALQDCTVFGFEDNNSSQSIAGVIEAGGTPFGFEIRTPDKSFAVYAESAESRQAWLDGIREARNEWLQGRRTLQAEEDSILARRDRRRSVAAAAAAAKARQSVYSLHAPQAPIVEGQELADVSLSADAPTVANPTASPVARPMSLSTLPTTTSFAALLSSAGAATANALPLRVLEDYNAPAWVPDSRADRCMSCSEPFGVFRRKHHCRLCGRVVCWSCSTQKFIIASYDEGKEDAVARACDSCYESTFPPLTPADGAEGEDPNATASSEQAAQCCPADAIEQASSAKGGTLISTVDSEQRTERSARTPTVRFESSRESSVENDDPATPADGQDLQQDNATATVSAIQSTGTDGDHMKSLTAPLKALAREGGPMSAPSQLDAGALLHPEIVPRRGRTGAHLATRFPSNIGGNPPAGPNGPARAALARLSTTNSVAPHVHAATSGSGTFRLAPPRITTPEDEGGPVIRLFGNQGGRSGLMGAQGSYFAGAIIPEDGPVSDIEQSAARISIDGPAPLTQSGGNDACASPPRSSRAPAPRPSLGTAGSSTQSNSTGPVDPSLARHRSRKKPMSAAARLSTYYGSSLQTTSLNSSGTGSNGNSGGVSSTAFPTKGAS
ncbi:unnamed protein product [Sympodiomycopsis kandeliae]